MPNIAYERVSDNDAEEELVDIPSQRVRSNPELALRPPIYYGDGPFDPPSSEEDEDHYQDKPGHHGVLGSDGFGDSEPGNGLRVGGGKVSTSAASSSKLTFILPTAPGCSEVSHILFGVIGVFVRLYWRIRRNQSLLWEAIPCVKGAQGIP